MSADAGAAEELVAGIDSSTQSCKVVVCETASGRIVRQGRAPHPPGSEVDPEHWWRALREAVAAAGGLADVSAVAVAGQQHGMVALDEQGRVVRPALLWNDTRSAAAAERLRAEFGEAALAARTGLVPVASFTVSKLRWLRDAEPARARSTAAVALPHDWLSWRLAGYGPGHASPRGPRLDALRTDRSDASGTGYWSASSGDYDRELLRAALGHDAQLPEVVGPLGFGATTAGGAEHGIPDGLPIAAGSGDNAGAALGLGVTSGEAVISIGTSGTVFGVSAQPANDPSGSVAGFADARGAFLPLVATLNAARVLDGIAALLGVDHAELGRLALASPPGARGLVLQPYFEGERTPNRPDATATLFGMTLASTRREHLARAAIEGMLCGLADGLNALRRAGFSAQSAALVGGAAQNAAVQRVASQVFDLPIRIPRPAEYVAIGAARQAASALRGEWRHWPVEHLTRLEPAHEPVIREQYRAR
ncbi:xylulokinase [Leucobacter massiliensis]|uniref:Xylulose kinase n=1 Tax=Leucobacter massiliensis TaxID=1686285 RepID=A0A2S9QRM1_9MICO|nr:xylulokinase [Leucobacter massiliensis]PRI12247.1 xylulokinase [Leucobacter massiliensis]